MDLRESAFWVRFRAHRAAYTLTVLLTLSVGILIGTVISYGVKGQEKNNSADATPLSVPTPQQMSNQFAQISKDLEPSVVNINTESTIKPTRRRPGDQDGQDDQGGQNPFDDFFNHFFGGQGGSNQGPIHERSLGSGVIVDSKGYIVTNRHVVDKADRVRVRLQDDPPGVQHEAKVIGVDEETDLAVIKIDVNRALPAAKLGNSDSMQVGDWVLAIGSPFGLTETVTAGIVSAKGRNAADLNMSNHQFQSFIQTDAAINPGNSGGPLVDMQGQVIGINTAILTDTSAYAGVGFAMPSNTVVSVYNQLIGPEHRVARGSIGVLFDAQQNPAIARMYGAGSGVTISSVQAGSPAEKGGLKIGDTLVSVDGKTVKNGDELVSEIASRKPGTKVEIGYLRDGKKEQTSITVADRAKLFAARLGAQDEDNSENGPAESKLGISVRSITPDIASKLDIAAGKGVVVDDVKPGSFGEDISLSRGDVILEINKQPVNSAEEFNRIQSTLKSGDDVVLLVRERGAGAQGGTVFLGNTLP
jgi:serine protease Do